MSCCSEPENLKAYEADTKTGWAEACKRCGRTWSLKSPPPASKKGGDR